LRHTITVVPHRFYAPGLNESDQTVALPDEEAQHLVRVLRIQPGSEVRVFNGRGTERAARVELADKKGVVLRVTGAVSAAEELPFPLTLAQAVLKGDAMDEVVRDAVMLGITSFVPVVTARSETSATQLARGRRTERWQRVAVSSAKQCGRAVVPVIGEPQTLQSVLARDPDQHLILLVEPGDRRRERVPDLPDRKGIHAGAGVTLVVGPEGGWAREEIDAAESSAAHLVTLGTRTLRADAAPIVALSVLQYMWGVL
jgi:16S rRNA (uracil1498-N3)-methyltransferase